MNLLDQLHSLNSGGSIELLLIPIIFVGCLWLIRTDFKKSLYLLLVLSVFLHKELFSIYRWDIMAVRLYMLALFVNGLAVLFDNRHNWKSYTVYLKDPFILLLGLLWLARGISILFTKNFVASVFLFGFFSTVCVLGLYIYLTFKNSPLEILNYIKFYIFILFLTGLFGFFQLYYYQITGQVIGAMWPVPGNVPRVGSTFWDVNHFGGLLYSLMPVLGVFTILAKGYKSKALNGVAFVLLTVILLLTNSRTAWIGAFFALLSFVLVLVYKWQKGRGILAILLSIVLLIIPLVAEYNDKQSPFRAKVRDYLHYRMDSFDSHMLLIQGTIAVFEDYPILGGGYGSFFENFKETEVADVFYSRDPAAFNTRVPAHTIWGELLAETGIVGFVLFFLLALVVLGQLFFVGLTSEKFQVTLLSTAMGSAVVGFLTAGVFYSYNAEFFWIVIFLYFTYGVSQTKGLINLNIISKHFLSIKGLAPGILILLSSLFLFWGLGSTHLEPWDEAIYAKVAKNVVNTKDLMTLYWFPNVAWFEKPPLGIWLMSGSMSLFGFNSWGARIPSALAGLITIFLVYKIATKMYGKTAGFFSGFALLTTFEFLFYARKSMLDVMVTLFITLAVYMYVLAREFTISLPTSSLNSANKQMQYWAYAGIAIGAAVMVKGVVGLLAGLVILINEVFLFFTEQREQTLKIRTRVKSLLLEYSVFLFFIILVALPWHLHMFSLYGREFYQTYIQYHVLERAGQGIEEKSKPAFWYVEVIKVSMRLWFVGLILAIPTFILNALIGMKSVFIKKLKFKAPTYKQDIFMLLWALSIFTFFSISASKIKWYIIPVYPALAIIVGVFTARAVNYISLRFENRFYIVKGLLIIAAVGIHLFYVYSNANLAFATDTTRKQATMLMAKDEIYGVEKMLYVDAKLETPLVLFYTDGPFIGLGYGDLQSRVLSGPFGEDTVFITKESRYRNFDAERESVKLKLRDDEWVLAYAPSPYEDDLDEIAEIKAQISLYEQTLTQRTLTSEELTDYLTLDARLRELLLKVEAFESGNYN